MNMDFNNEKVWIEKLQNLGIISKDDKCVCGAKMIVAQRKRNKLGNVLTTWRCTNSKCQKYRSIYKPTKRNAKLLKTALQIEKHSYEPVQSSEQATDVVHKLLNPEVSLAFECDQCPKKFATAWGLTVHSSKTHKKKTNKKKK